MPPTPTPRHSWSSKQPDRTIPQRSAMFWTRRVQRGVPLTDGRTRKDLVGEASRRRTGYIGAWTGRPTPACPGGIRTRCVMPLLVTTASQRHLTAAQRHHLRIRRVTTEALGACSQISSVGSDNGCYVNGAVRQVAPVQIKHHRVSRAGCIPGTADTAPRGPVRPSEPDAWQSRHRRDRETP